MIISFEQLYQSRCQKIGEEYKPHFWKPQAIAREDFTLYGDEKSPVQDEWGVNEIIPRLLALGIHLEIPVGEFVRAATLKDLPNDEHLKLLLKSNIADEARHLKGFQYAQAVYPLDEKVLAEAENISNRWQETMNRHHPLFLAAVLEIGVFLISLGCLRTFGGKSLATLAAKVAEDEFRHVATNRSVLLAMNYDAWNPPPELTNLAKDTLDWCFKGINIPSRYVGENFNLDFLLNSSNSLLTTGEARDFNESVYLVDHVLPFEVSNATQYSRTIDYEISAA